MTKEEIIQKLQEIDTLQSEEEKVELLEKLSLAIKELNVDLRKVIETTKAEMGA
jgi:hypothetical protein